MNRVRELAEIKDISQKQLTVDLGIAQSTLSDWMRQKKDPKGENLKKVADYFGVNPLVVKGLAPIPTDYAAKTWDYVDYTPDLLPETSDEDIMALRERYRRDPNYRLLFDAAEKAAPEHLRAAAAMLKALEGKNGDL